MRGSALVVLTAALLAGCEDSTSPSEEARVYALGRIGLLQPPIGLGEDHGPPFLIADSLLLEHGRSRQPGQSASVLTHVVVMQDAAGTRTRSETRHGYAVAGSVLSYDTCPLGSLCIAALVYAPLEFHIVGDSLFQIVPNASPLPAGMVYGRADRR